MFKINYFYDPVRLKDIQLDTLPVFTSFFGATLLSTYSQYFVMCGHVYIEIKNLWPHSIKNVMISWICTALHRILIIKFMNEIQCRHIGKLKYADNTESHAK
jgi:hypothetical protein